MIELIYLSMFVGCVSMTISKSSIFRVLRTKIKHLDCPYCIGHWIALVVYLIYLPNVNIFTHVINYFAIVCLTAIWQLIIGLLFITLEYKGG